MAEDFDALMAEIPDEEPESPAAPASTESQPPKVAELDALLPDAEDVDEEFRGKPVTEAVRLAKQWKHEAKVAAERNQHWNTIVSRAEMAEKALEFFKQQNAQRPAPQPETDESLLQRLSQRPTAVLPEVVQQYTAPLQQQLEEQRREMFAMQAENARITAAKMAGVDDLDAWESLKWRLAPIMQANQWDPRDPRAWAEAKNIYLADADRFAKPRVEVPKTPAPPGGNARSQVRTGNAPRLRSRDRQNAEDLLAGFGIAPDDPAFAQFEEFAAGGKD